MLFRRIAVAIGAAAIAALPGSAVLAAPSRQDTSFLQTAYELHLAEITLGQIAWRKTTDPQIKELAGRLMVSHIRLNAAVTDTARTLKFRLAQPVSADQGALAGTYRAASAATIDDLYLAAELTAQKRAGDVVAQQIAKGSDPLVKKVAQDAAPVLAQHQQLVRAAAN